MNRQGYMLHLSNVDASTWWATFGREPMLSSDGFGTGATPWRAVQVAAWEALGKTPDGPPEPTAADVILPRCLYSARFPRAIGHVRPSVACNGSMLPGSWLPAQAS